MAFFLNEKKHLIIIWLGQKIVLTCIMLTNVKTSYLATLLKIMNEIHEFKWKDCIEELKTLKVV